MLVAATLVVAGAIAGGAREWLAGRDGAETPASDLAPFDPGSGALPGAPLPEAVDPVPVTVISQVVDVSFPNDVAMLGLVTSGDHGHGGIFELVRYFRTAGGVVHKHTLLKPPAESANITGIASAGDGRLFAAICMGEFCHYEGGPKPDAYTVFYESTDGGVTWHEIARRQGEWSVRDGPGAEALVNPLGNAQWELIPSGEVESPPPGAHADRVPFAFGGQIAWVSEDGERILDADGGTVARFHIEFPLWYVGGVFATAALAGQEPVLGVMFAGGFLPSGRYKSYVGLFDPSEGTPAKLLLFPAGLPYFGAWFSPSSFVGQVGYELRGVCADDRLSGGAAPAIIDIERATYGFFGDAFCRQAWQRVIALTRGPFARVTGTGDCLNVRDAPATDQPIIGCFADNVLLGSTGGVAESGGQVWLGVVTPAGEPGWAVAEFLERQ